MLSDVGMVKTYPKYISPEAGEFSPSCYKITKCTSLFVDIFCQLVFPCSYLWFQRRSAPSLHLSFYGKHFYSSCFCTFYGLRAAHHASTSHMQACTKYHSYEHMSKMTVTIHGISCARVTQASHHLASAIYYKCTHKTGGQ